MGAGVSGIIVGEPILCDLPPFCSLLSCGLGVGGRHDHPAASFPGPRPGSAFLFNVWQRP